MNESMTCCEAEPLLPLVADGAIDPDSDPSLFAHLAACPACQRAVAAHDLIGLAIARPSTRPQRASLLRFWPYAAAAGLILATGAVVAQPGRAPTATVAQIAESAQAALTVPPPVAAEAKAETKAEAPTDVIAVQRTDGSTFYLVRQGNAWLPLDPANLDGPATPATPAHGGGSGVQVRY